MTNGAAAFVLVHGAFHGGWCWRPVAQRLRAAGSDVWAPTLTGLGERAHLLSPSTNLSAFIEEIARLLDWEKLSQVVLVGHSFGGLVASGVADRRPERIGRLVLLDGLVAESGECALDLLDAATASERRRAAEGLTAPPPDPRAFGVACPETAAWMRRRMTPHPLAALSEPLHLAAPPGAGRPCSYIRCVEPAYPAMRKSHARAAERRDWRMHTLAACHEAMITDPDAVADLLLRIAQAPR
jgi:pimeloyl-ACP methyl ester carboxylesterase